MSGRRATTRWTLRVGVATIAALAVAAIPRAKSQEKPSVLSADRKLIREKIVALHGEIEFLKLAMEIEHAAILADIGEGAKVPLLFAEMDWMAGSVDAPDLIRMVGELLDDPRVAEEMGQSAVDKFRKAHADAKAKDESAQREMVALLLQEAEKDEAAIRRSNLSTRKQGYAALARELAGRRLDLEDAEAEYRRPR